MILVMERFPKLCYIVIAFLFIYCCLFINTEKIYAASTINGKNHEKEIKRSLESMRDMDYQTWQIIVYPNPKVSKNLILRIVGYPGSLRIDHPTDLVVTSGRKKWDLEDITIKNKAIYEKFDDSVAEFDLSPLIYELDKNRPLKLSLTRLVNDLPIPPYLVSEWRTLAE